MSRKDDKHIIVGLDIGTSKVVAIVGELQVDGQIPLPARQGHKGKPAGGLERNQAIVDRVGCLQALPVQPLGPLDVAGIPTQDPRIVERVRQAKGIAQRPEAGQALFDQRAGPGVVALPGP